MRKERGFTLIELLIVLAILAILIGIVAMSIGNIRETAQKRGLQSERQVVETAIDSYVTLQENLPSVPDQVTPIKAEADNETFGEYLRRDSKYYYTWTGVGTTGQAVIGWNGVFAATGKATLCCDVTGCATITKTAPLTITDCVVP